MNKNENKIRYLSGGTRAAIKATHEATVNAVLPAGIRRPVVDKGHRFYNKDRWTGRKVLALMCEWAHKHPECQPTMMDLERWVYEANYERVDDPAVVIASTPEKLSDRTAMALVGGGYHEAWHTLYSCRRNLTVTEVAEIILPRWAQVKDWSKYYKLLMEWSNIIEDIRIERLGCAEFPGTRNKMCDLQDFIIDLESEGRENARAHGMPTSNAMTVVCSVFRDVGLGYNTDKQRAALAKYAEESPEAVALVLEGPMAPLLREAIALDRKDEMGCIRLAMDVLILLSQISGEGDEEGDEENEGGGKTQCPSCGAPSSKLRLRPKAGSYSNKDENYALLVCTACGHQEEVELNDDSESQGDGQGEGIQTEGFDNEESDDDSNGQGGASDDEGEESDEDSEGSSGDKGDESDEEGDESEGADSSEGEDSDEKAEGEGDESDEDSDSESDSKAESDNGKPEKDTSAKDHDAKVEAKSDDNGFDPSKTNDSNQGGGHHDSGSTPDYSEFQDFVENALEEGQSGTEGMLDNNDALSQEFDAQVEKEENREGKVEDGERRYKPYDKNLDEVEFVGPSYNGQGQDERKAKKIGNAVKSEASYLRARLRNIVRAAEMTNTVHGVAKGRDLSERMLVDTYSSIRSGQAPKRAYYKRDVKQDTSMSAAVVLDQSSSMSGMLADATKMLMAITEPLDSLGVKVQVSGFRNGNYGDYDSYRGPSDGRDKPYHRFHGVRNDVFKSFDERFNSVKYRFANTMATGSTPMADGIQFGLDALNTRREAYRVLFVITDGCPDGGHEPVIRRQIRLAKEAGIHVIGVGIGYGAEYVKDLFPDYVWGESHELPKQLVAKLNKLLDARTAGKRGRRMRRSG